MVLRRRHQCPPLAPPLWRRLPLPFKPRSRTPSHTYEHRYTLQYALQGGVSLSQSTNLGPPFVPEDEIYSPHGIRCISHESYRRALYLGRGGPQDQYARIRHTRWVCRSHLQKYRYTKNRPIGVTVVFVNGTYTPSERDVCVRLGLVALPFPSRASDDKICGRYSIRREVPSQLFKV